MADHLLLRALIALLALGGLADALYFTFAYYGRIRGARWVPAILCAREGSSCVTVVQTKYARVFGPPNSLFGVVYYLCVIAWSLGGPVWDSSPAGETPLVQWCAWLLLAASAASVLLGLYLIYALRRKLAVDCPLCYTAHAVNAALLVLLLLAPR